MNTPAMFEVPPPVGDELVKCDRCPVAIVATLDGLRARDWVAYNGTSFTGAPLNVRICPDCRACEGEDHDSARDRLGPVSEVQQGLWPADR